MSVLAVANTTLVARIRRRTRDRDSARLEPGTLDHLGDGVDLVLDHFREGFRPLADRLHAEQGQLRGDIAFLYDRAAFRSNFADDVLRYSGATVDADVRDHIEAWNEIGQRRELRQ